MSVWFDEHMKSTRGKFLAIAGALILLGVLAFVLQPGPPESECVPTNGPTSGFMDEEKDCAISIESFEEISDYNSSPKPFRIAGLLLIVAGIVVGVVGLVKGRRSGTSGSPSP